jgi:hypothetical protein
MDIKQENDRNVEQPFEKEAVTYADPKLKRGRRPYQKPSFRFERVFETRALSCGKVSPNQSSCAMNFKNS